MSWNTVYHATDAELGLSAADPIADLRQVINDAPLTQVERLLGAAEGGKLARGFYNLGDRGCLLYFLTGVRSKDELLAYAYDEATGMAARRLVRLWDYGRLSLPQVIDTLRAHIEARRDANRLEEETLARSTMAAAL